MVTFLYRTNKYYMIFKESSLRNTPYKLILWKVIYSFQKNSDNREGLLSHDIGNEKGKIGSG